MPPSTLSWGDEDDEDDATRAAKPRKQASSSKRGGWLARLNAAHEQKEASVRDLSRSERRAANDAEKRQRKKAAALGASERRSADASKANDEDVGEPVSHAGSGPRRTRPDPASSGDPATSSVAVAATLAKRVVALALLAAALFLLLVAAVYLDSNRPDLWPPIWRLRGAKKLSATQSLAFARALAEEAAARLASAARARAPTAPPPGRRRARRRRRRRARRRRLRRRRGAVGARRGGAADAERRRVRRGEGGAVSGAPRARAREVWRRTAGRGVLLVTFVSRVSSRESVCRTIPSKRRKRRRRGGGLRGDVSSHPFVFPSRALRTSLCTAFVASRAKRHCSRRTAG